MTIVATTTFLDAVVPPGNRYIGFTDKTKTTDAGRMTISCSSFESALEGVNRAERFARRDNIQDLYFALASFKEAKVYKELKVYKEFRVARGHKAFKAYKEFKVTLVHSVV